MQDFKHIQAWRRAHALRIALHRATRHFARRGFSNLRTQLTKAADSIAATIVEGCGAATNKELVRFLDMSINSANETEYHLLKAKDHGLMSPDEWQRFTAETIEVRKMTYGYRRSVLKNDSKAQLAAKQAQKKRPDA